MAESTAFHTWILETQDMVPTSAISPNLKHFFITLDCWSLPLDPTATVRVDPSLASIDCSLLCLCIFWPWAFRQGW